MSSTWEQVQRRLCLDHSQLSIEHSLSEIEEALERWWNHPHQVDAFDKVLDALFNVRWMLQLHLDGVWLAWNGTPISFRWLQGSTSRPFEGVGTKTFSSSWMESSMRFEIELSIATPSSVQWLISGFSAGVE